MIILGIDPGSQHLGFGVIQVEGTKETVIEYGVLNLNLKHSHALRLKNIYAFITEIIQRTKPDECAIEMPIYAKNAQAMLKLGRAQAAAMLAALNLDVPVTEYTPKAIKKAVTGNGNAKKEQVWYMMRMMFKLKDDKGLDASDALGAAWCHANRSKQGSTKQHKDWGSFVRDNPGRVKR